MAFLRIERHRETPFPRVEELHAEQVDKGRRGDGAPPHLVEELGPREIPRPPGARLRIFPFNGAAALRFDGVVTHGGGVSMRRRPLSSDSLRNRARRLRSSVAGY